MPTTIKDIAKKINLSPTTVSLVLNNKADRIPQKTKDLVIRTAKELNYYPNQIAISLVKKQTKTVGLILPDIRNEFFSTLAKSVEVEAHAHGWSVILCNTGDYHDRDIEYIQLLASKNVDGILFCMSADTTLEKFKVIINIMNNLEIPYIMIDRTYMLPGINTALIDHRLGGYLATTHLLELGHRRIACITGPKHLSDSNKRLLGYRDALNEYSVPYDSNLIYNGNYQMDGGLRGIQTLDPESYTAVFAFNDLMALGAIKGLKLINKRIPEDVSLVGYDDISYTEMLEVPLTTIRQPISKVGEIATRSLVDTLEKTDKKVEKIPLFEPKIIVRKSTAPPRVK